MSKHRRNAHVQPKKPSADVPVTGPGRFTATRFLSNCTDDSYWFLVGEWGAGNQLVARRVPIDALPAVVIMAAWGRSVEVQFVDDFDALTDRYWENLRECNHPDKFLATCVYLLHQRGQGPDDESFEAVRIPAIYEELFT